jgi:hypothetical protein
MDMVALQWWAKFFRGIGRPCEVSRAITAISDDRPQRRDRDRGSGKRDRHRALLAIEAQRLRGPLPDIATR